MREEELPAAEAWDVAVDRAGKVFGIAVSPLRNASNVSEFGTKLGDAAAEKAAACSELVTRLASLGKDLSIAEDDTRRLRTARTTSALVEALNVLLGKARIEKLAAVEPETSLEAMGTSLHKAKAVLDALERTRWALFPSLHQLTDDRSDAAGRLLRELAEAVAADEYAVALGGKLPGLEDRAIKLLARPAKPVPPPPPPPPRPPGGASVVREGADRNLDRERLRAVAIKLEALFSEVPTG